MQAKGYVARLFDRPERGDPRGIPAAPAARPAPHNSVVARVEAGRAATRRGGAPRSSIDRADEGVAMRSTGQPWGENGTELERLLFFSDAVFAIAITLLAIDINAPDLPAGAARDELPRRVFDLAPAIAAYVISFLVIGRYWIAHHRLFHYIVRYDGRLLWLNLLFLLAIGFLPFPPDLLSRYGDTPFAAACYAAFLAVVGLLLAALWAYAAAGHRLVDRHLDRDLIRRTLLRLLTPRPSSSCRLGSRRSARRPPRSPGSSSRWRTHPEGSPYVGRGRRAPRRSTEPARG